MIRVAILDDHQGIIDGYRYRLGQDKGVEIVAAIGYGEELEDLLTRHAIDLLILDVHVPTSPVNPNIYPILSIIPKLLQLYPNLAILMISMNAQPAMVRACLDVGANGYITKDDQDSIQKLDKVVHAIIDGEIYISPFLVELLNRHSNRDEANRLTSRQVEVLMLCASNLDTTTAELAKRLNVANSTLRNLLSGIYLKLNVRNRASAIAKAQQLGLLRPGNPISKGNKTGEE